MTNTADSGSIATENDPSGTFHGIGPTDEVEPSTKDLSAGMSAETQPSTAPATPTLVAARGQFVSNKEATPLKTRTVKLSSNVSMFSRSPTGKLPVLEWAVSRRSRDPPVRLPSRSSREGRV